MPDLSIRPATPADLTALRDLIRGLAEYEKLLDHFAANEAKLRATLFSSRPIGNALIARLGERPVGYAVYFTSFSTFAAGPGCFLEDLYVEPQCRGQGIGKALIKAVAEEAVKSGAVRLDWQVLDWNESAQGFYRSLGAEVHPEWWTCRLTGAALATLGGTAQEATVPTFRTERLVLRPPAESDAPRIVELMRSPEISANTANIPFPYTLDDAESYLEKTRSGVSRGRYSWTIEHPEHDMIGDVFAAVTGPRVCYLGYWLGEAHWGKGYMTEALLRIVQHCFEDLDAVRVEADRFGHNPASGRVLEKAGLVLEGVRRKAFFKDGRHLDMYHYGLAREEPDAI